LQSNPGIHLREPGSCSIHTIPRRQNDHQLLPLRHTHLLGPGAGPPFRRRKPPSHPRKHPTSNPSPQISTLKNAKKAKFDNANPRSGDTVAKYKAALSPADYGKWERGEAAHKNAMENAPFFFAAVILGNVAGLPASKYLSIEL
jgi:hypothetical protein